MIPHLPPELIHLVLSNVYYLNFPWDTPDYRTLASCCLVNSDWKTASQPLLFYRISLTVVSSFGRFVGSKFGQPNLLAHVRSLSLSLCGPRHSKDPGLVTVPSMVEMMSSCTQLYELILYSSRLFSLGSDDLEQIESLVTSSSWKIRSLRLMECSSQSFILYELLSVLPDVQFLVLGIELSAASPLWTPAVELYELKLHRTLPSEVLVWLLSSSRQSLRILELRDLPSASTALDLVPCFPNLQSLRLMRFNSHSAAILLQCANLVELVLLNVPTIFPLPPLPASLQHLYLPIQTYSTGIDIESVLRAVNSDNLPNLRILSFTGASDLASPLQAACLSKKINFRASPSKSWTNDDPVKTLHFPRRKSISNFLLMR